LDCVKISFALQHRQDPSLRSADVFPFAASLPPKIAIFRLRFAGYQDPEAEKKNVLVTSLLQHNEIALPKSDQYRFSPNNIHLQTGEEVKRIHKMINKGEMV